jgi:hypothetical protein
MTEGNHSDIWAAINSVRDKVEEVRVKGCARSEGEAAMATKLSGLEEKLTEFMLEMTKEVGAIRKSMADGLHDIKIWAYGTLGGIALALIGYLGDKLVTALK